MPFKRIALATDVRLLEKPENNRFAFDSDNSVVSFEYDIGTNVYFRCRAITADVPNGNGDYFEEAELKRSFKTFIGVGLYKDHDSDSVDKSVGKVLWAEWVPEGKYVQCYCSVNRKLAPDLAERIESGMVSTVSMGCMVGEAICGVKGCGNVAHNQMELCQHMMPGTGIKGKATGAKGEIAYEINKMLQFTELSLVTVPADPTARIFEVYASMQEGRISKAQAQKEMEFLLMTAANAAVKRALEDAIPAQSYTTSVDTTTSGTPTVINFSPKDPNSSDSSREEEQKTVARNVNSPEERQMNLTITYAKGSSLANSFFVAKEADAEFRVSATDVIPLIIQQAISEGQPGIATPEQIIEDLVEKTDGLAEFKKWAKKRKKKNKKAKEKMLEKMKGKDEDKDKDKDKDKEAESAAAPALETEAEPVAEAPAADAAPAAEAYVPDTSGTSPMDPAGVSDEPAHDLGDKSDEGHMPENPTGEGDKPVSQEDLAKVLQFIEQFMQDKQPEPAASSKRAPVKTAVKTESPKDHMDKGTGYGDKSGKNPAAIKEISKVESPADYTDRGTSKGKVPGTMPKGATAKVSIKRKAMDQNWAINQKEIEKVAKPGKPQQAAPTDIAWNVKEMASEQIKLEKSGGPASGSAIKKLFNRLPSGGSGAAPQALDLKSSKAVRENLQLKAEKEVLEKENDKLKNDKAMEAIADRIYEIVKALREKNFLKAGQEDEIINLLGTKLKDMDNLQVVFDLVSKLSAQEATTDTPSAGEPAQSEEAEAGPPQIYEELSQNEDAVTTLSNIWNL